MDCCHVISLILIGDCGVLNFIGMSPLVLPVYTQHVHNSHCIMKALEFKMLGAELAHAYRYNLLHARHKLAMGLEQEHTNDDYCNPRTHAPSCNNTGLYNTLVQLLTNWYYYRRWPRV